MTREQSRTCNGSKLRKKQKGPGQRRRHKCRDTGSAKDCGQKRTTANQKLDVHATSILCTNALCMQNLFHACLKAKWGWQRQARPHVRSLGVPVIRDSIPALDRTRSTIEEDRRDAASVAATTSTKRPSPAYTSVNLDSNREPRPEARLLESLRRCESRPKTPAAAHQGVPSRARLPSNYACTSMYCTAGCASSPPGC